MLRRWFLHPPKFQRRGQTFPGPQGLGRAGTREAEDPKSKSHSLHHGCPDPHLSGQLFSPLRRARGRPGRSAAISGVAASRRPPLPSCQALRAVPSGHLHDCARQIPQGHTGGAGGSKADTSSHSWPERGSGALCRVSKKRGGRRHRVGWPGTFQKQQESQPEKNREGQWTFAGQPPHAQPSSPALWQRPSCLKYW